MWSKLIGNLRLPSLPHLQQTIPYRSAANFLKSLHACVYRKGSAVLRKASATSLSVIADALSAHDALIALRWSFFDMFMVYIFGGC